MHAEAVRADDFAGRATACWGLVARGEAALPWVDSGLSDDDPDLRADAVGVLLRIGIPSGWLPRLRSLAQGEDETGDILFEHFERLDAPLLPPADATGDYRSPAERDYEDRLLLKGAWSPLTDKLLFARASFGTVAHTLITGVRGRRVLANTGHPLVSRPVYGDRLEVLLEHLLPLEVGARKMLIVPTANSEWTAVSDSRFSIIGGGGGASAWLAVGGIECVTVESSPHRRNYPNRYGSNAVRGITSFEPTTPGAYDVAWTRTGEGERKWYFVEETHRVPSVSDPAARTIAQRFTHDHLVEMAAQFGLRPFDADFYAPDGSGVLIQRTDPTDSDYRPLTLAQMRGEHPL